MYVSIIFLHTKELGSVHKYITRKKLNLNVLSMHLCSGNAQEFQNSLAEIKRDIHNVGVAKVSQAIPLIHSSVYSFSNCIGAIPLSSLWQSKCEPV